MRFFQLFAGFLSAAGAIAAAVGVWLQFAAYKEEEFVRRNGAISLAWSIIRDSNGVMHDVGQATSLEFLAYQGQLFGDIVLNNSVISAFGFKNTIYRSNLSGSQFCHTSIHLSSFYNVNISRSKFINSFLGSVRMYDAKAYGSRFDSTSIFQMDASRSSFVAASFVGASIHGGVFSDADFSGADLRGLITRPMYVAFENLAGKRPFDQSVSDAEALSVLEKFLPLASDSPESPKILVNFSGAIFNDADIRGADLRNSNLTQSQLDSACADQTTQPPQGVTVTKVCTEAGRAASRRSFLQGKEDAPAPEACVPRRGG
ncbi:pentapeptide repeat-containing protein [Xanthobacter sp.]|uniref:pentapeptide repeat-containing protein n=1 Tax=Xanthobacter sp. TaxID=35809 RepID=UPI0035AE3526